MKGLVRVFIVFVLATVALTLPIAAASAHGQNDARLIAKDAEAGPYTVSLWNVLGDDSSELPAHVIVMVGGDQRIPADATVQLRVAAATIAASPSATVTGAWETATGVDPGAIVSVEIVSDGARWASLSYEVPALPEPTLISRVVAALSVFLTTAAVYWLIRRTARVWRRPMRLEPQWQ